MTDPKEPHARELTSDLLLRAAPFIFVLFWSTGYIGAKYGLPYAEPFTFLSLRHSVSILLFLGIALASRVKWPGVVPAFHSFVVGVLVHGSYLGSVFWALEAGMPSGVAALIVGLQPLMSAILAGWWLGEDVTMRHWVGLGLGFCGLALVLAPKLNLDGSGITALTVLVVSGGVLAMTIGTLYQKHFATGSDLRTGALYQYLGGLAFTGVAALLMETGQVEWTGEFVAALAWLVLVLSFGAILLLMLMIRHGAVSRVATVFYLVPPTTALMGWAMFGEVMTPIQLVGMLVTVAGVALAGRRWRQAPA